MTTDNTDLKLDLDGNPLPWYQQPRPQKYLLAGALVFAMIVVFGLPNWVPEIAQDVEIQGSQAAPTVEKSPFQDAQEAKARREAQSILADIVQLQSKLEQQQISKWANEEYTQLLMLGDKADEAYRSRNFLEALEEYQNILEGFKTLNDKTPSIHKEHIKLGHLALQEGNSDTASSAFSVATAIESHPDSNIDSTDGTKGLKQASNLDEVLKLLRQSQLYSQAGHPEKAITSVQSALDLDPYSEQAKKRQAELKDTLTEQKYQKAMSQGYSALEKKSFQSAKQAFKQALSIKPNSKAASLALNQTANQSESAFVASLSNKAKQLESQELWHEALDAYQKLLDFDAGLIKPRVGLLRTQARADLSDRLDQAINDPLSLNDSQNRLRAEQALSEAQALNDSRTKITGQISALDTLLKRAEMPITIQLKSDNQTQITLLREAVLGRFLDREVALTPGHYTLVGTREGYRDVRQDFTVEFKPQNNQETITIVCNEEV